MKFLPSGLAVLEHDTHLSRWVEECGRLCHDGSVAAHILPHLPVGGVAVDGGASLGDHTSAYAEKVGPTGRVLAFEVNPPAIECLRHNMARYPWVKVFDNGLSNVHSYSTLIPNTENVGATQVAPPGTGRSGSVALVTLDWAMTGFTRCDLIKLDLEGYELFALQGAIHTIDTYRPVIVLEINAGCLARMGLAETGIFNFLKQHNYSWSPLAPSLQPPFKDQYDIICIPS